MKLLFISLFIVFTISSQGQRFENFEHTDIFFPEEDMEHLKKGKILNDSIYFSQYKIENMIIPETTDVPESITNILDSYKFKPFFDDLIEDYDTMYCLSLIEKSRQRMTFYYIGSIPINPEYETYIFMADYDWKQNYSIYRQFFMINIQENRLLSIFDVAEYSCSWGHHIHVFTVIEPPGILTRKTFMKDGTTIFLDEKRNKQQKEPGFVSNYTLNNQGYIVPDKKIDFQENYDYEENALVKLPEKFPKYPGGREELQKFIKNNIIYPKEAQEKGIEEVVVIDLIIEKDGTLSNIKLFSELKEYDFGFGEEAIRVISMMPKWEPGQVNGKNVRVSYRLPVKFSLDR